MKFMHTQRTQDKAVHMSWRLKLLTVISARCSCKRITNPSNNFYTHITNTERRIHQHQRTVTAKKRTTTTIINALHNKFGVREEGGFYKISRT